MVSVSKSNAVIISTRYRLNLLEKLLLFEQNINAIDVPDKLNDPFSNLAPHLLCQIAAKQVQNHLTSQTELLHNFGVGVISTEKQLGKCLAYWW